MTDDRPDAGIGRLFEAERRADEAAAPELDALLSRAPRRRRLRPAFPRAAWGAAAVLLAAGAAILLRGGDGRHRPTPADAGADLARWEAPTDAFLVTPGSELRGEIPELAPSSSHAGPEPLSAPTKGVDR